MKEFSVLVVDDEPANIDILKDILIQHYQVKVAPSGEIALKIVAKAAPDLILLDIMMPDLDGLEVCRQLKANPKTAGIPVIFVTALGQGEDEERGFEVGAVDYIAKPIVPALVLARVKTHIALAHQQRQTEREVEMRTRELAQSQLSAISMIAAAGHYNDNDTGLHIWRMAAYARELAQAIGWSAERAKLLEFAAPMHDTGKIGIPDAILKAPRRLTEEEMVVMRTHARIGYEILNNSDAVLFKLAAEVALTHHEKWDGSGYPSGLKGDAIPESGRIVAIADVFDALTMVRPYKKAWTEDEAFDYIQSQAGSHFDPDMVSTFLNIRSQILAIKHKADEVSEQHDSSALTMRFVDD